MSTHSHQRPVLLVEDNPLDAQLTQAALAAQNHPVSVVHVRDGQEALDYLLCQGAFAAREPEAPALVLLDLKMPKIDGLDLLRRIKSEPALLLMPVLALTSSREPTDLVQCYQLGINAYVVKPVSFADFVATMASVVTFWTQINQTPHKLP
jgi:CheY-like chemotaxis protein